MHEADLAILQLVLQSSILLSQSMQFSLTLSRSTLHSLQSFKQLILVSLHIIQLQHTQADQNLAAALEAALDCC